MLSSGCSFKKHSDDTRSIEVKNYKAHQDVDLFSSVRTDSLEDISANLNSAPPQALQQVNAEGDSLMHVAIKRGNAEIISLLYSHGLSIYIKNTKTGVRGLDLPLDAEVKSQLQEINSANWTSIKYLIENNRDQELITTVTKSQMPCDRVINYLLEKSISDRNIGKHDTTSSKISSFTSVADCRNIKQDILMTWYSREFKFQYQKSFVDLSVLFALKKIGLNSFFLVGKSGSLISPYFLIDSKFAVFSESDHLHTGDFYFSADREAVRAQFSEITKIDDQVSFYTDSSMKNVIPYAPATQLKGRNLPEPFFSDVLEIKTENVAEQIPSFTDERGLLL